MRQLTKVPLVYVAFLDHSQGSAQDDNVISCEIVGWLRNETALTYNIVTWVCNSDLMDHNSEMYTILKSTVTKFREIKEKRRGTVRR